MAGFLRAIRNTVPDDGIVVSGMTQVGYYSRPYYPVYQPGTFLTLSYFGNLGYAYPTALGAKVARPEAAVVAISGDGGFLFNSGAKRLLASLPMRPRGASPGVLD